MIIIAHRCGTDKFEEQTIAAARNSLALGANYVEVDIRFTADNVPVVIHDPTPAGLYGVITPVCRITADSFCSMRRLADPSVCGHRFEDYIKCGIKPMLFHCKEGGPRLLMIVEMCKKAGILSDVVFGVSRIEDVCLLKETDSSIKVLAFMHRDWMINDFAQAGADYIRLWEGWLTPENIDAVSKAGKKLWIMSNCGDVGEVDDDSYEKYEKTGAHGVLINRVAPAVEYYRK